MRYSPKPVYLIFNSISTVICINIKVYPSTMVIMQISSVLLVHFIFLGLFSDLLSTNPNSVVVQSPEDNEEKITEIRMEKSQLRLSTNSERPRGPIVRVMRPFKEGSRIIWKEVARESIDRIREYNPLVYVRNNYGAYNPFSRRTISSRRTTENSINLRRMTEESINLRRMTEESINSRTATQKSITDANSERPVGGNRSQMPQNNIKGNNNFPEKSVITTFSPAASENVEPLSGINGQEDVTKSAEKISPDSNFFAGIVNDFAFKLMETLNLETNFVVSPLSIFIALAMCYLGSDGNTKSQMEQILGMNDNAVHGEHLHQGIKDLISLVVKDSSSDYQLLVANGMFFGKNFTVDALFEKNLEDYYRTELKNLDFGNPQSALRTINDWVAENTRNMITSIINSPPPALTPLILLNAVFFKGIWKMQFPLNLTYNGKFHSLDGSDSDVSFMTLFDETFPMFRSDEHRHTFIELPYKGNQMSMVIGLPYTQQEKPISSIRDQTLCYLRDAMMDTKLESMAIPKFRLEYRHSLRKSLLELGLTDIFDRKEVNLSKIRKENDVYVSGIFQKSVVEVNEEGTTASAVTEVRFVPLTSRNTVNFVANHPFAFYIIHEASGLVLFYGKVFDFNSQSNVANNRRENIRFRPRPNSDA